MATPLATAFVRLRPEFGGFRREAEREMDRAGRQAGDTFGDSFGDSVRRSDAPERAGDEAGRSFGGAFSDSLKVAAGIAIAAIGEQAAQAFSATFQQALDLSGAQGLLQAQLGLTEAESKRIGGVAGKLFADAYGDSMEDVNTAITSVIQNIDGMKGASEDSLRTMTAQAITTGRVLGEDVGAVTRSVSQMLRTGMAPNAKVAFDILNRGAQLGLNSSEDLLDTFKEYSTQFRKLGIDGTTALGLIQQGLKGGARDADIVADALKEFSLRAIDGSEETIEAYKALGLNAKDMSKQIAAGGTGATKGLDTVLTKLRGIDSDTKRAAIATKLFGTQSEDLGDALLALDPSTATKGLGNLAGATDRAGKAMGETSQAKFERFKRGLQTSVVDYVANTVIPAVEKFSQVLGSMGVSGSGVASVAIPLLAIGVGAKVASSAVGAVSAGISGIAKAGKGIGAVSSGVGRMAQGFRSAQVAESAFSGRMGTLGGRLRTMWTAGINGARTMATATLNGARAATTAALAHTRLALAHARAGAAAALAASRTLLAAAAQRAVMIATRAWALAQVALNVVLSANPIGLVVLAIGALVAAIVIAYRNSNTFRNIVNAAFRGIAAAAKFMWNTVLKIIFEAIKFYIMKILIPYYKLLWTIVKTVFSGISAAVRAAWNSVIKPIWNAIKDFIQRILIPNFNRFMEANKRVWSAVRGAISAGWNAISGYFNRLKSGIGLVGTAFGRGATAIKSAWDRVKGYTKTPINFVIGTVYNKGIVGLWNQVMSWLHLPASLRLGRLPMLASGGPMPVRPGVFDRPTAIVGEGDPNHPEYVIPTDPKYRGRAMALWQAAGAKMQFLQVGGIIGNIKKLAGKVTNLGGRALDLITNPGKVWDSLVSKLPSAEGLRTSPFGNAAAEMPKLIMRYARDYALKFFKAFGDGYGGSGQGVVKAALKYIGVGDDRGMDNNNMFTRHYGWPAGTPWCALFASKAIQDAKASKRYPGTPTAAVATFNARMRHVPTSDGKPGDLATYGSNDHVNIIVKKVAGGYDTVGGNQGPKVNRYVRGGQATVLRPLATGGAISGHIREVFQQRNLDPGDKRNKVLQGLRQMKKPRFDNGGFGLGWPFHDKKPEAVFTSSQFRDIHEMVKRGSRPSIDVYVTGVPEIPSDKQIANAVDRVLTMHKGW